MLLVMALFFTSSMFLILKHPISLGVCLLVQSLLISLITGLLNLNFWYSYILFLIMVGGMLVIFIYMTSIASNEKFSPTMLPLMLAPLCLVILWMVLEMDMDLLNNLMVKENSWMLSLTKFFTFPQMNIMLFLISYLLVTLIAVVKITKMQYGPLRPSM